MANLTITKGQDVTIPFTLTGVDLTGQTLLFTIKTPQNLNVVDSADSNAIAKASQTTHTNPTSGISSIVLLGSAAAGQATSNIAAGTYDWDLWTKDGTGTMTPRTAGPQKLTVLPAVTQRRS